MRSSQTSTKWHDHQSVIWVNHQSDDLVEVVQFEIVRRYLLSLTKNDKMTK